VVQKTGGAAPLPAAAAANICTWPRAKGGFPRLTDVASIANKGGLGEDRPPRRSRRSATTPHVGSKNATCMALPTNQSIAPGRSSAAMREANQEQAFHPIYHYAFVTDAEEGAESRSTSTR